MFFMMLWKPCSLGKIFECSKNFQLHYCLLAYYVLYICIMFQNNDMSKLPATETDHLKLVARDFCGETILATAYPLGDYWNPGWFTNWLDNNGGKDYLLNDTHTEEGRMNVAKFNNYEAAWKENVATFTSKTSVQEKIHDLLILHTINGSAHDIYGGSIEGLHRTLAILHALLVSNIDPYTVRLVLNSLTLVDFILAGLRVGTSKPTEASIQDAVKDCLDSEKPNVMMDTPIPMQLRYEGP